MTNRFNDIDKLFRDAVQKETVPQFKEEYWTEMEHILNTRKGRKRRIFLWSFVSGIFLITIISSIFVLSNGAIKQKYTPHALNLNKTTTLYPDSKYFSTTENLGFITKSSQKKENNTLKLEKENSTFISTVFKNGIGMLLNNYSSLLSSQGNKNVPIPFANPSDYNRSNTTTEDVELDLPIRPASPLENERKSFTSTLRPVKKQRMAGKLTWSLNVKAGLTQAYTSPRPFETGIADFSVTTEYAYRRMILRTGFGAQITNNANLNVSKRAMIYSFGVISVHTDLSYRDFYDLFIPIEVGFSTKRMSYGVGVQANYLIFTRMDADYYENDELIEKSRYFGSTDGLNALSLQGYLWGEYNLMQNIALGLNVGTNVTSRVKDGNFFNKSETSGPFYGQIAIKYRLR